MQIHTHNAELKARIEEATVELVERNEELSCANQSILDIQKKLGHSRRLAAVGQLAATVAHELGTPLHSISGHLHLLMEEHLSVDAKRRLAIMQSQLDRIIDSIQDILDTTRPQDAQFAPVDLNSLIEDVTLLVMPETVSKELTIEKDLAPSLPPVFGVSGRIEEVFLSIIDNAIDASCPGSVISVSTRCGEADGCDIISPNGGWVSVIVRDRGRGIPEEQLKRLFEPFYTTKAYGQGTGLGLAISKEIIEGHNGHIKIESAPGKGSAFTVFLPAEKSKV